MAAGTQLPPQLIRYWSSAGKGGQVIRWGVPGDFDRCRTEIQKAITTDGKPPLSDAVISGLCATLHRMNTGATPGHAPGEQTGKG
jgi:hypothetical protein